ncbi:MAG: hypothetical protein Q9169_000319 [Polycauliona sp. 2 TL-2023]
MDARVRKNPRLALSVASRETLSLDLWQGFSDSVSINVHLAESPLNGELPPLIEYISPNLDWYPVPSYWAFTQGPLAIWDQSGNRIDIKNHALSENKPLELDSNQYLRGDRINFHQVDRMGQSLLKVLRSMLKPGTYYYLGFKEKTYPMRAVQCDSHFGRLQPGANDCWVDVACTQDRVKFAVAAGTQIPRFQVALSICKNGRPDGDWIVIKITSIDKRTVGVRMPDPNFELNNNGLSLWLQVHSPKQRFVSNSVYYGNEGRQPTWQQDDGMLLRT